MRREPALASFLLLAACRTEQTVVTPDPSLERMVDQEKRLPYQVDPALPQGMVMQKPPEGTMTVDTPIGDPLVQEGIADGRWAGHIPVALDRAMLEEGRRRFDTFCATCHGRSGDGNSIVADRMALRKPTNLLSDGVRGYPPGRVFQTIRQGYGLMPSYRVQLSIGDTWSVVAYLRALQLAGGVRVAELPANVVAELEKEAP
jgi:mono/diheme cytochrome c family protein